MVTCMFLVGMIPYNGDCLITFCVIHMTHFSQIDPGADILVNMFYSPSMYVALVTVSLQVLHPRAVDTQDAFLQAIPPCYAWGEAWLASPLWLRERMSCFGSVSVGRLPVLVRPTADAVSCHLCDLCYF